jgi:hypothetical protein
MEKTLAGGLVGETSGDALSTSRRSQITSQNGQSHHLDVLGDTLELLFLHDASS